LFTAVLLPTPLLTTSFPAVLSFSFNDTAPPETYTLSLHDALPILRAKGVKTAFVTLHVGAGTFQPVRSENLAEHKMHSEWYTIRSEEHTSELQSRENLVCRLLLEKKKKKKQPKTKTNAQKNQSQYN